MLSERAAKLSRNLYQWDYSRPFSIPDTTNMPPEGYQLKKMDEALFELYVKEMVFSYSYLWISAENYLSKGFGFCIVKNQALVSACNTYYVSDGSAEIDIVTKEEYRRMGLHPLPAGHQSHMGLRQRKCNSKVLAEKLDFRSVETYEMHWLSIPRKMSH